MSKAIMRPGVHHYYSKSFTKGKKEKENVSSLLIGENLTLLHANNKSIDQPVHSCSLISAISINSLFGLNNGYTCYTQN